MSDQADRVPVFEKDDQADLEAAAYADEDKRDKAILTISSTALGICIAFVRDTVSASTSRVALALFALAAFSFVLSILSSLWSLQAGAQGKWRAIDFRNAGDFDRKSKWDFAVSKLNTLSLVLCSVGIMLLTVFVMTTIG